MNLKNWGRIGGMFGLVALVSAGFNFLFVTGTVASAGVIVRLVVGIAGVAFWLTTNRGEHGFGRGAFYGIASALSAVVLLAAVAGLNYIAVKKPKTWDLTKERIFTLSDQTTSVLEGMKDPVTVEAFFAGGEPDYLELKSRLDQYTAQTEKLKVEFIDPFKHPARVKEANISQNGPRIVVHSGNKEARAKDISEQALTNALIEVTRGATKKVYFTKGHGEHAVADKTERGLKQFVDNLKAEGYQTDEIVLAEHKEMPAEAQAVVIAGPVAAFSAAEVKLLVDWVEKGGKLVAMIDPGPETGLESAFENWGVHVGKDEVIDPQAQNPEVAIAQSYAEHPITQPRNSASTLATALPAARSVSKAANAPMNWVVTELAKTGPHAWGETSSLTGRVEYNPSQDLRGPVPLATSASKGTDSRVVVIGNSLFAANGYYRLVGNRDFALNAVSWVAKEDLRISIRPRQRQGNRLFLTAEQKDTMTLFAFDVLPMGLLFAGLVVWQSRKSR
jgi:ABC-type uncharacterized transport system involved in gliding motility auxiliary subunit